MARAHRWWGIVRNSAARHETRSHRPGCRRVCAAVQRTQLKSSSAAPRFANDWHYPSRSLNCFRRHCISTFTSYRATWSSHLFANSSGEESRIGVSVPLEPDRPWVHDTVAGGRQRRFHDEEAQIPYLRTQARVG